MKYGTYYISAAWTNNLSTDEQNAVKGKVFKVTVTPSTNVRLVKDGSSDVVETTDTDASRDIYLSVENANKAKPTITVLDDYGGTALSNSNTWKYAIRTNNTAGLEWSSENAGDGSHTAVYHSTDKLNFALGTEYTPAP